MTTARDAAPVLSDPASGCAWDGVLVGNGEEAPIGQFYRVAPSARSLFSSRDIGGASLQRCTGWGGYGISACNLGGRVPFGFPLLPSPSSLLPSLVT